MIALDTNILIRLLVNDDKAQAALAEQFIRRHTAEDPVFVGREVILELIWLLMSRYRYPLEAVRQALDRLFMSANLAIEEEDAIKTALYLAERTGADIADAIIATIALQRDCTQIVTFDKDAAKRIPGMELLA
ncbi:PIN domain-containing protein [Devosia sp. BK]|uniref:PIN domain-containing protein n=1 Tax=Devosia sp. BK TaxID=2871706 RepID=UPI00293AEE70|nr:PIN domain-containing protein [Devosia sp. BK]MDV3252962.1 PIN domain-containing protein [Devosia sp. BK]